MIGFLVGAVIYACFHFNYGRYARHCSLIVEGPFLRFTTGGFFTEVKRVHFRAVSDYSTHDGPLLKLFGIKVLSFQIMGRRAQNNTIAAIVEADRVCEELAQIDAIREV